MGCTCTACFPSGNNFIAIPAHCVDLQVLCQVSEKKNTTQCKGCRRYEFGKESKGYK